MFVHAPLIDQYLVVILFFFLRFFFSIQCRIKSQSIYLSIYLFIVERCVYDLDILYCFYIYIYLSREEINYNKTSIYCHSVSEKESEPLLDTVLFRSKKKKSSSLIHDSRRVTNKYWLKTTISLQTFDFLLMLSANKKDEFIVLGSLLFYVHSFLIFIIIIIIDILGTYG